ncbi:site-specific DNA-methyltransferase [Xanthobacter agilis]|uniref:site-specific DNA-methyltransferase (adenine-specific) n=1 Tax=Xanthobacter agilis TaxID=47492 RepID=A0ABU0LAL7_XANAG|nr:site-specific DNA-methyltransferase [Xanthobacter agilis]MDQ0504189.1 adenine-specific DNA-methyltransferase [Xanthobacter agilis]
MSDIKKMNREAPEAQSADLMANNVVALKSLFPEIAVEGKLDLDLLKELLGLSVAQSDERFGLNWHGKRKARQIALTPSLGTLLPCPAESLNWDTTQNLMIEGDNLEVLKLLQKSFAAKIKLIYIDPPYNTGKDFVYPDDYRDNIGNYLELTGQTEGGRRISSNAEASGRFHTDWLNMMYPRLRVARTLLHPEGVILVSCDDGEVANLKLMLNEIFGEENFVAQFVWKARQFSDTRANTNISTDHEYILAYSRDDGISLKGVGRDESKFANPDNDPRGEWMSRSMLGLATRDQRPNLHYEIREPSTGRVFPPNPSTGWRYSKEKMTELISEGKVLFPKSDQGRPREKKFRNEMRAEFIAFRSIIDGVHTADGTQEIRSLFGVDLFAFPKPTELVASLIEQVAGEGDIVMDFFAGSGTTGHAVMKKNSAESVGRRYILVQLPEPLDPSNREQKVAADFCDKLKLPRRISELTKERLRRAAQRIEGESPLLKGDLGFRVFKLASSNIRAWQPDVADLEDSLLKNAEHLVQGRKEQDVLYELLLKLGLDLCVPIETKTMAGKTVHSIGGGTLIVCLADGLTKDVVEELAKGIVEWRKALAPAVDTRVVFKDTGFADDIAKTNMAAILNQAGISDVRSL